MLINPVFTPHVRYVRIIIFIRHVPAETSNSTDITIRLDIQMERYNIVRRMYD